MHALPNSRYVVKTSISALTCDWLDAAVSDHTMTTNIYIHTQNLSQIYINLICLKFRIFE